MPIDHPLGERREPQVAPTDHRRRLQDRLPGAAAVEAGRQGTPLRPGPVRLQAGADDGRWRRRGHAGRVDAGAGADPRRWKLFPPSLEVNTQVDGDAAPAGRLPGGPHVPSAHMATRSRWPTRPPGQRSRWPWRREGVHCSHWPAPSRRAPPTTVRSFSTSQPLVPCRTSWVAGTGPAPIGTPVSTSVQASVPTGERSSCTVMAFGGKHRHPDVAAGHLHGRDGGGGRRPGGCTGRQTMPPSWVDHTRVGLTA